MHSLNIPIFAAAAVLAVALTGLVRRYALRANLLDIPNDRSSHHVATPRGGGLSIVVVILGAVIGLHLFGELPTAELFALAIGGTLVAGVGFIDDHGHLPALWRFLIQVIAATSGVAILGGLPQIQFGDSLVDLGLVGHALAIFFTVWLVNLYNFMDGIDGIAAVEAICVLGGAFAMVSMGDNGGPVMTVLVVSAAAVIGFLVWNWPPAKIFMGDVGSGFIGFVLAILAIITSKQGLLPIWCWLILAGVFIVDSTVTLATRVINGEEWYSAHKNHAYQKASRRLNSHKSVTLAVCIINLAWLLPIAFLVFSEPDLGWWLTFVAWTPLGLLVLGFKAGRPDLNT